MRNPLRSEDAMFRVVLWAVAVAVVVVVVVVVVCVVVVVVGGLGQREHHVDVLLRVVVAEHRSAPL